jgi:GNAT superfamily N-acetyltransferase
MAELVVRALETPAEVDAFFQLAIQEFFLQENIDAIVPNWRQYVEEYPGFQPGQLRGAFRGRDYLGGYLLYDRRLRLGPARLRSCCIGAVLTHPEQRRQGVATALMQDAVAYAVQQGYDLLLLNGIPNFYQRFGFSPVLDIAWVTLNRQEILAEPPTDYQVRLATVADAPVMLDLYERHFGLYTGSFDRSLAQQVHQLRGLFPQHLPWLAVSPSGEIEGYLHFWWDSDLQFAHEAVAENWPAAVALLQYHARLREAKPESPDGWGWVLPPTSPTFYLLAEHLSLGTHFDHHPFAGWMARPAALTGLCRSFLPMWRERWQQASSGWTGILALQIGEETCFLELSSAGVNLLTPQPPEAHPLKLSPQRFTQLLFGYRPATWLAQQPGQQLPPELIPLLDILFPRSQSWIAGTDQF